jgi:predicted site-specific integrase-resolvase
MTEKAEWYLPVSHAADLLGCNRLEMLHLLKTGLLSFIMMPDSRIKISEDSVSRLMQQPVTDRLVN